MGMTMRTIRIREATVQDTGIRDEAGQFQRGIYPIGIAPRSRGRPMAMRQRKCACLTCNLLPPNDA